MEKSKHKFILDFKAPTSYAFHAISSNYFVYEVLQKKNDRKSKQLYFRLFRTGLIGDILYKKANRHIKSEEHTPEMELLAGLFESYMFLVRSIYDYLFKIFTYTTALLLLMSYIAENITGKNLIEQIKYMEEQSKTKQVT